MIWSHLKSKRGEFKFIKSSIAFPFHHAFPREFTCLDGRERAIYHSRLLHPHQQKPKARKAPLPWPHRNSRNEVASWMMYKRRKKGEISLRRCQMVKGEWMKKLSRWFVYLPRDSPQLLCVVVNGGKNSIILLTCHTSIYFLLYRKWCSIGSLDSSQ